MPAEHQTQQPDQPATPLAPPASAAQGPVKEQQQQLPVENCPICWRDVQPGEPSEKCINRHPIYHRSCIYKWLVMRLNQGQETNCPNCRADMTWALNNPPPLPTCFICKQEIGPYSMQIACRDCAIVFHQNELLAHVIQLNNVQEPLVCLDCPADMSWVLGLPTAPAFLEDFIIQPAELDDDISNFNLYSQSESECELDEA